VNRSHHPSSSCFIAVFPAFSDESLPHFETLRLLFYVEIFQVSEVEYRHFNVGLSLPVLSLYRQNKKLTLLYVLPP